MAFEKATRFALVTGTEVRLGTTQEWVTDRGRSYDAQALSEVRQQKCLAHVLRSISEVVKTKTGRGRSFASV